MCPSTALHYETDFGIYHICDSCLDASKSVHWKQRETIFQNSFHKYDTVFAEETFLDDRTIALVVDETVKLSNLPFTSLFWWEVKYQ